MSKIHPTAIVAAGASLGEGVEIGPFCVVGPEVVLHDRVVLKSHVVVEGRTEVGEACEVYPFASLGQPPQDLKFRGGPSALIIGPRTRIREHVTLNTGTEGGGFVTRVGSDCFLLTASHVAHDCQVGNHVILSNNTMLAGHVHVGDFVIFSGGSAAHQFSRIGEHAFIGGLTGVEGDVIPFGMVIGARGWMAGLNLVGLRRRGFARESIQTLLKAYKVLFSGEGTLPERVAATEEGFGTDPLVRRVLDFIHEGGDRQLVPASSRYGGH